MSKSKSTKRTKSTKSTKRTPTKLDEKTSAIVVAEYMAIEHVDAKELEVITGDAPNRGLTLREVALTFRVAEVLGVPPAFEMAPRYQVALARAQEYMLIKRAADEARAAEVRS